MVPVENATPHRSAESTKCLRNKLDSVPVADPAYLVAALVLAQWEKAFLDGNFAPAKNEAPLSAKPRAARARSGWYWSTVKVFRWEFGWKVPLRVKVELAEATLAEVCVPRPKGRPRQKPERVIADRGYDADPLRRRLKKRSIELIDRRRDF